MKRLLMVVFLSSFFSLAFAQNQDGSGNQANNCPDGAVNCTSSNQFIGDVSTPSSAENSSSQASQSNTSSNSNQSGNNISNGFDSRNQTTQNATANQQNSIGDTSSTASGNTSSQSATTTSQGGAGGAGVGKASSSSGGNKIQGSQTTVSSGGTSVGGTSYNNDTKMIYIPPVVPVTPPSHLAVGNIVKDSSGCGPLQKLVKTPVEGTISGFFSDSAISQGATYDLVENRDEEGILVPYHYEFLPDGSYIKYGHQVVETTAIIGVAGVKNLAIGGGGSSGSWGQAGGGVSGTNQQLVTTIRLRLCDLGTFRNTPKVYEPIVPILIYGKDGG